MDDFIESLATLSVETSPVTSTNPPPLASRHPISSATPRGCELIETRANVHNDDIHILLALDEGYLTGSKDGTVKQWDASFEAPTILSSKTGYENWASKDCLLHSDLLVVSRRNGLLEISHRNSRTGASWLFEKEIVVAKQISTTTCKERNIKRIDAIVPIADCAAAFKPFESIVLLGTPGSLILFDVTTHQTLEFSIHASEWIYRIVPVAEGPDSTTIAVVAGAGVGLFKLSCARPKDGLSRRNWTIGCLRWLIHPDNADLTYCRGATKKPHIADLFYYKPSNSLVAACFDSKIREISLEQSRINVHSTHRGRVWCLCTSTQLPHTFLSGSDDRRMVMWDMRAGTRSVWSSQSLEGRVSNIIPGHGDYTIVSSSCPKDPSQSKLKGCVRLWDVRFMGKAQ